MNKNVVNNRYELFLLKITPIIAYTGFVCYLKKTPIK